MNDDIIITGDALDELLGAEPVARCSECGRLTWMPDMVDMTCYMPQPNGDRCAGKFRRVQS